MSYAYAIRMVRQPLTWLVIAAMALLTLLALESTGSMHAPSLVPLTTVSDHGHSGGGNTNHCTNGHGLDNPKNKHCRGSSGGQ